MPADLFSSGVFIVSWGATYLVHSTALLAGVWTILRLNRTAGHSLRENLWKTALVGGVVTASAQTLLVPQGPFGEITFVVEAFAPESSKAIAVPFELKNGFAVADGPQARATDNATREYLADKAVPEPGSREIVFVADSLVAEAIPVEVEVEAGDRRIAVGSHAAPSWWIASRNAMRRAPIAGALALAVGLALAAILLGIARCVWQTLSLRKKLADCPVIARGPARRLLDELCRHVPGLPEVRLLSTNNDPEPAAFGVRQWTIVLPERAANDLPEAELRALLAHELAHLVRGDSTWLFISRLVCSCLAFQPLNHLARREWQRAAEYLCDGWAVSRTGTPLALARCLTEVAGWRRSGEASAAMLAATGRKSGLADRIERLLDVADMSETWNELRDRRRTLLAGGVVLGLVVWCVPRVQLAVASAATVVEANVHELPAVDVTQNTDKGQIGAVRESSGLNVTESPADAATFSKQEASQEGEGSTISVKPATATPVARPTDLAALLEALDLELSELEKELLELEPLLAQKNVPPQAARLGSRLQFEIAKLKQRRDVLRVQAKQPGGTNSP